MAPHVRSSSGADSQPRTTPVQLQIMSDLHLETPRLLPMYADFRIEANSPYLALLGDIGHASDARLLHFLELQLQQFAVVFYVLGNHEPYQSGSDAEPRTHEDAVRTMEVFAAAVEERRRREAEESGSPEAGQFVFLNRRRFDISDSVTVLGCTLFSNIAEAQMGTAALFVSDFSNIADWTVDKHNAAHREDLGWLNSQVEAISLTEPHRQIVVLTHYSPTAHPEANSPEHLEDSRNVQSAFVTDLAREPCWTNPVVKAWAFGHTHHNCDFIEQQTGKRVVANQRGYGRGEAFDFDAAKVVAIDEPRTPTI
ncbi:Ser/Thr protein phosphatase [Tolypocladium paradoxum]|uniref:Ser/Thr protein phosphatase n=1 Tax=Tolypocladium paradoxum TaxID=94208 RepID=A0A2S4L5J5_9HYPO|nr:Ser/Thr protein phosphatase [Tolypocladium paradoxum]